MRGTIESSTQWTTIATFYKRVNATLFQALIQLESRRGRCQAPRPEVANSEDVLLLTLDLEQVVCLQAAMAQTLSDRPSQYQTLLELTEEWLDFNFPEWRDPRTSTR